MNTMNVAVANVPNVLANLANLFSSPFKLRFSGAFYFCAMFS